VQMRAMFKQLIERRRAQLQSGREPQEIEQEDRSEMPKTSTRSERNLSGIRIGEQDRGASDGC
jgi:hypothetical protein